MRTVLNILLILFLEVMCGVTLIFLYGLLSSCLFDEYGFGRSRINEAIYYAVTLLPPFIYCWMKYLKTKRKGAKDNSLIYLSASLVYVVGGFVLMLIFTNFYLLGN